MDLEYEGTTRELDSTYSVNKHNPDTFEIEDSMTDGQRQRPQRMKSGKIWRKRVGFSGFLNGLSIAAVKPLDMYLSNYDDGCGCRVLSNDSHEGRSKPGAKNVVVRDEVRRCN
jgi:hypothetical protein